MTSYPIITLKPGRDVHVRNRHHAIFQNSINGFPKVEDGSIVEVRSNGGDFLCYAHFNKEAYICGRAIAFKEGDPLEQLRHTILSAIAMREAVDASGEVYAPAGTTAYRLVNAEGDAVPGLIVDRYEKIIVVQLTTKGMDHMREWIVDLLMEACKPQGIFEKSTGPARKKEGLESREGWLKKPAKSDEKIIVSERGLKFSIRLEGSQKTGLFLDQREMRALVREHANGRTVLDCCSYVGGFSVSALAGGAVHATAVDYDAAALAQASEHVAMNGFAKEKFTSFSEDAFNFLRRSPMPQAYDFIILDPPAFAKRSSDIDQAKHAYTDLNRAAMELLPQGGLLLTCSCSYQIDVPLFQTIVFHAARQANRSAKILSRHRQAIDHPINIFHPETDYLKSLLLWIE